MREIYIIFTGLLRQESKFYQSIVNFLAISEKYNIKKIFFITWEDELNRLRNKSLIKLCDNELIKFVGCPKLKNNSLGNYLPQMHHYKVGLDRVKSIIKPIRKNSIRSNNNDIYILKTRTDVQVQNSFIEKIFLYDFEIKNDDVLTHKIWIPWAHISKPFYFEDAIFFSHISSMEKLYNIDPNFTYRFIGQGITHIRRFITPFLKVKKYENFCNIIMTNKNKLMVNSLKLKTSEFKDYEGGVDFILTYHEILDKYFYIFTETNHSINFRMWNDKDNKKSKNAFLWLLYENIK